MSHYAIENEPSKNREGGQQGPSKNPLSRVDMQTYIREAMETICGFAERLNLPTDTTRIPSDK